MNEQLLAKYMEEPASSEANLMFKYSLPAAESNLPRKTHTSNYGGASRGSHDPFSICR
jgi:hypothetical protein